MFLDTCFLVDLIMEKNLMVAVTAKKFGMPVLTRGVEHFGKIPGQAVVTY